MELARIGNLNHPVFSANPKYREIAGRAGHAITAINREIALTDWDLLLCEVFVVVENGVEEDSFPLAR